MTPVNQTAASEHAQNRQTLIHKQDIIKNKNETTIHSIANSVRSLRNGILMQRVF